MALIKMQKNLNIKVFSENHINKNYIFVKGMFYVVFLVLAYLLNLVDYFFTLYWINNYGLDVESNPIERWMFENDLAGFIKIIVVGILFFILALLTKKSKKAIKSGYLIFGVYTVVVIYHTFMAFYVI